MFSQTELEVNSVDASTVTSSSQNRTGSINNPNHMGSINSRNHTGSIARLILMWGCFLKRCAALLSQNNCTLSWAQKEPWHILPKLILIKKKKKLFIAQWRGTQLKLIDLNVVQTFIEGNGRLTAPELLKSDKRKCNILHQCIIKVLLWQHRTFKLVPENSLRQTTVVISH